MGRKAQHTQEQAFMTADELAAKGVEVTATTLRDALGGGSMTTIYKHLAAWEESRKTAPAPAAIEMPDSVKAQFAGVWQALSVEAGREIAAIREKADTDIKAIKRRLDEALGAIEQLEAEAEADASALEVAQTELATVAQAAQQAATDAAAREAALAATAEQQRRQIEAQQTELSRVHGEAEAARQQHQAEIVRLTGQIADQAAAIKAAEFSLNTLRGDLADAVVKLDAAADRERALISEAEQANAGARLVADQLKNLTAHHADQLKEQKARSLEVIGKLEKDKQTLSADLTAARKEARDLAVLHGQAVGELEALRTQAASQADTIRRLTPAPAKSSGK